VVGRDREEAEQPVGLLEGDEPLAVVVDLEVEPLVEDELPDVLRAKLAVELDHARPFAVQRVLEARARALRELD